MSQEDTIDISDVNDAEVHAYIAAAKIFGQFNEMYAQARVSRTQSGRVIAAAEQGEEAQQGEQLD